jgi:hypothetical protein
MPPIVLPQAESETRMPQAAAIVVTVFVNFCFLLP